MQTNYAAYRGLYLCEPFFFAPAQHWRIDGEGPENQEVHDEEAGEAKGHEGQGEASTAIELLMAATYCYRAKDGEPLEVQRPMGKPPKFVMRRGKKFHRDYATENGVAPCDAWKRRTGNHWRGSPLLSEGSGCSPRQAKAFERAMAMRGVPTKFCEKTGKAILESRDHRNRYLKARGMYDKDAGYGDYAGDVVKSAPMNFDFEGDE